MKRMTTGMGIAALVAAAASGASLADVITFGPFAINGAQEVPPVPTMATGTGTVTLNTVTNEVAWNIEFSGLTSAEVAAHFHAPAPAGQDAGAIIGLPLGSPKIGSTFVTDQQKQWLLDGLWYVNIHTINFGGGEIRGQVAPVTHIAFTEVEPNESKAQATAVGPMQPGYWIVGSTTGSSTVTPGPASADTFLVTIAPTSPGISRNRLMLTTAGTVGHSASIRGITQTAAPLGPWPGPVGTRNESTDASSQSHTIPAGTTTRMVQWYGFGHGERLYYRVTGTASTTSPYTARFESEPVMPVDIGTFQPGQITITTMNQGHATDTDLWIYDSAFNPIMGYGNDDNSIAGGGTGVGLQSILRRDYAPGVYYLAISSYNLQNDQASPCDDDFPAGVLLDFPGAVLTSSTASNVNTTFAITDANGTTQVPAVRPGAFDILFFRFTVGGGPMVDCNGNGIDDAQEIAGNPALDCFNPLVVNDPHTVGGPDGILDECQCPGNWNRDGQVNSTDISSFITSWLAAVNTGGTGADIDCSGSVNSSDISNYITRWLSAVNQTIPHDNCP